MALPARLAATWGAVGSSLMMAPGGAVAGSLAGGRGLSRVLVVSEAIGSDYPTRLMVHKATSIARSTQLHRQDRPCIQGSVGRLRAEERTRDGGRTEHSARTRSQPRQGPLLLGQRLCRQLKAKLLNRFSHRSLLPSAWDGTHPPRAFATIARPVSSSPLCGPRPQTKIRSPRTPIP